MNRKYFISGHVEDFKGDSPYNIQVSLGTGSSAKTVKVDSEGYYVFIVESGTYTVSVSCPGYESQSKSVTVTGNVFNVDFILGAPTGGFSLTGTVTDGETGTAVSSAIVSLYKGTILLEQDTTSTDGEYSFDGLDYNETYTVKVSANRYQTFTSEPFVCMGDSVKDITLSKKTYKVYGTITHLNYDQPIEGAIVTLYKDGIPPRVIATATTDKEGYYSFENLPGPNTFGIKVEKQYYQNKVADVSIEYGDVKCDLGMTPVEGYTAVYGKVKHTKYDLPIKDATVKFWYLSSLLDSITTDETGEYYFFPLEKFSSYRIEAMKDEYEQYTNNITGTDQDINLNIYLFTVPSHLTGTVKNSKDGLPIKDALLKVRHASNYDYYSVKTGADGSFTFDNRYALFNGEGYVLEVSKEGYIRHEDRFVCHGDTIKNFTLNYVGFKIYGVVVDETGIAMPNVYTQLEGDDYDEACFTDEDGMYEYRGLKEDEEYTLTVKETQSSPTIIQKDVNVENEDVQLDIEVPNTIKIKGVVKDEDGNTVADVATHLIGYDYCSSGYSRWVDTDENGEFEYNDIVKNCSYVFYANEVDPTGYEITREVDTEEEDVELEIVLPDHSLKLTGTVTNEDGEPIANTQTFLVNYDGEHSYSKSGRTDEEGKYKFKDLFSNTKYLLTIYAPVGSEYYQVQEIIQVNEESVTFDVTMYDKVANISGTVTHHQTGSGLSGVTMTLLSDDDEELDTYTTSDDGAYSFDADTDEVYKLKAEHQLCITQQAKLNVFHEDVVKDFTLRGINISGVVYHGSTMIEGATVSWVKKGTVKDSTTTNEDGEYLLEDVDAHRTSGLSLKVETTGGIYDDVSVPISTAESDIEKDIELPYAGVTVSGTVTNSDGEAVSGATVQLIGGASSIKDTTTTNSDGEYSFENVTKNRNFGINVIAEGYETKYQAIAVLESDLVQDIELESLENTITFYVKDENNNPLQDVQITFLHDQSNPVFTDSTGKAEYSTSLTTATYLAQKDGYSSVQKTLENITGDITENVSLHLNTVKVSGVVANAEGDVMQNIKVKLVEKTTEAEMEVKEPGFWGKIKKALTGDTSYFKQVNTNDDGEYSFDDVPFNKTYTLIIEGLGGYTDYSEDIVVHETNIDNDVELTVSHGDVKFKVLSKLGAVLPDVLVWIDDDVYEETDEDGECNFTLDAGEYTASIELADYETVEKTFSVNVPTKTINVSLSSRYVKISGICKNTDGERVPDATLRLYYEDTICNQTDTDSYGVYELTNVEKHLTYNLTISVDNYEPYSKWVTVEDHDIRLDITNLEPIETHYVVFLVTKSEDHNEPIFGALITLDGETTTTRPDGRGGFQNLPQGLYDATISYNGRKTLTKTFRILDEDLMDVPAYLELTILTGIVTMADGYNFPVEDATVELQHGGETIATTTTDKNGNFTFIGQTVVGDLYHIVVSKQYFETVNTDIFEATGDDIKIVSLPTAKYDLSGTVKEGTTPLAGVNMVLGVAHTTTYYEATTDENGYYIFTDKMHGGVEYIIAAIKSDYQTTEETFTCTGDTTKNLQLNKAVYSVSGTITDEFGSPVADATVDLRRTSVISSTTTSSSGTYTLSGMKKDVDNYVLRVTKQFYKTKASDLFDCSGTDITDKDLVISRSTYDVLGKVLDSETSEGIYGCTVKLYDYLGSVVQTVTTNSSGTYVISKKMYGGITYKIKVSHSDYTDYESEPFICTGTKSGFNINLSRKT